VGSTEFSMVLLIVTFFWPLMNTDSKLIFAVCYYQNSCDFQQSRSA
jgi:hypothetical protein